MTKTDDWSFPEELQPNAEEVEFDLKKCLDSVVMLRSNIPEDAFTATLLGTDRLGSGVVIGADGLILTIGYLITEAENIWLTTNAGNVIQATPIAYDQATGFGLVQPLGKLDIEPINRGSISEINTGDKLIIIGYGGKKRAIKTNVIAKHSFAGYWEYLIENALFTEPIHPQWGGAAVVGPTGDLVGIGSLLTQEAPDGKMVQANMAVPIDLLEPIIDDLLSSGRTKSPPRPWLGMYTAEDDLGLTVIDLADDGPAANSNVQIKDIIKAVDGSSVSTLPEMFTAIWNLGPAGTQIPLTINRDGLTVEIRVKSADRENFLKKPALH